LFGDWDATCMTVLPPAVCYNPISSPVARQTLGNLRSGWLCEVHSCLTGLFIAWNIPALTGIVYSFIGLSFQAYKFRFWRKQHRTALTVGNLLLALHA